MRVLSLFSGVGGMDMGLQRAGHQVVGMCEIDPKARSVLARHWPDVPIHDDVTTFETGEWVGRVDIVAGGSPCQDLSVAGKRAGLDGERSGLFWHQCRVADSVAAPWVLWENVAGALNSNDGADFAAVLWGITGALPVVPDGGWRSAGICVGPKRTAVWRLLDAQWFGVAQRRKRVFIVAGAGGVCGPEVLFESDGMFRDSAPSRSSGESVASTLGGGSGSRGWAPDTDRMTFVPDSEPLAYGMSQFAGYTEGVTTLTATDHKRPEQNVVVEPMVYAKPGRAQSAEDAETWKDGQVAPTLNQFDVGDTRTTVAVTETHGVRRLTPRECERLMGWPDDHTRWDNHGNEIADSHRYRMCGNGVVSNVTEWIGRRLPTERTN